MDQATEGVRTVGPTRRWAIFIIFGFYLTFHGYHTRDNDQAYRLPLLIDRQDPAIYADDPFVRAFDAFNPHRAFLTLLNLTSRLVGLSAALAILYGLTYLLTAYGIDRLTRAVWPEAGPWVGVVATGLVLTAKAGNLGTNHLFEPLLLDRLIAQGFGWVLLARLIEDPKRGLLWIAPCLAAASWIHPSLGLQLGLLILSICVIWGICKNCTNTDPRSVVFGFSLGVLGLLPSIVFAMSNGARLYKGMPTNEMWLLSAFVQSPQHMIPHLWRRPQWLAWACYPVLALLAVAGRKPTPARLRLLLTMAVIAVGLVLALAAIEGFSDLRVTLFQPFRMATLFRGLCLTLAADHVLGLWRRGDLEGSLRAVLLAVGLIGDWSLVAVTLAESTMVAAEWFSRAYPFSGKAVTPKLVGLIVLGLGLAYLGRHDTESGHQRLLIALVVSTAAVWLALRCKLAWNARRMAWVTALAWGVPLVALAAHALPLDYRNGFARTLIAHCRFGEVPTDDVERLAAWCRERTPAGARFIGPPGVKTFRLWALRPLAFNRASSPYHAEGLADWAARFRDHVGFRGSTAEFAQAYLANRQALEAHYFALDDEELADLAQRQGASHILALKPGGPTPSDAPLELLRAEGRYAVYRVRPGRLARRPPRPGLKAERQAAPGTTSAGTG